MAQMQKIIQSDHQFNFTAADNDGFHKTVHWINQGSNAIDPAATDPAINAPTSGTNPITWEQQDVYGKSRPWFRQPSSGNMTSMMGFNEIQRDAVPINNSAFVFVTPPDETYGEIWWYVPATGTANYGLVSGKAFYVKSAGVCGCTVENANTVPTTTMVIGTSGNAGAGNLFAYFSSGGPYNVTFRILYRYL